METHDQDDFSGIWHCSYWYPSNDHDGEDVSEYDVRVHQIGNSLVLESLPTASGAYMMVRLSTDGEIATGTWQENTAPRGAFKGSVYSGAMQLIVSKDKSRMEGKWVGIGRDYGIDAARIYTGRWELVRLGKNARSKGAPSALTNEIRS